MPASIAGLPACSWKLSPAAFTKLGLAPRVLVMVQAEEHASVPPYTRLWFTDAARRRETVSVHGHALGRIVKDIILSETLPSTSHSMTWPPSFGEVKAKVLLEMTPPNPSAVWTPHPATKP